MLPPMLILRPADGLSVPTGTRRQVTMRRLRNLWQRWRLLRASQPWQNDAGVARQIDRLALAVLALFGMRTACEFVLAVPERAFNPYGLSYQAGYVLTLLLACYAMARTANRASCVVPFASVVVAGQAAVVVVLTVIVESFGPTSQPLNWTVSAPIYYTAIGLIALVAYVAAVRTLKIGRIAPLVLIPIVIAAVALYGWLPWMSSWYTVPVQYANDGTRHRISVEWTYYNQYALMDDALDKVEKQRPGVTDLYFVGFAGYADQNVFRKEVDAVIHLFDERFDTKGRSIALVNNRATVDELPLATGSNLAYGLNEIGRRLDPEEDVLFLFLTSHGSKDLFSVNFWPLQPENLTSQDLREILDASGIKWRVIVISACYSGSFIDRLSDDHTLVITAADKDNTSFGCSNEADFTYFGRAYFDEALRKTFSFLDAFGTASRTIERRELTEGLTPSRPQIRIGAAIRPKLDDIRNRLAGLHPADAPPQQAATPAR
jgi:Peptidase C13 family